MMLKVRELRLARARENSFTQHHGNDGSMVASLSLANGLFSPTTTLQPGIMRETDKPLKAMWDALLTRRRTVMTQPAVAEYSMIC